MSKFTLDNFPTSKTGKEMLHRVSPIYDNSYVAKWLYQVMGMELDEIKTFFAEMREQVFATTVTWGIEYQEHKFSIVPDDNLSLEERRARLYRKKVNKFPLNPKRIENYFKNAWDLEVNIDETAHPGYIDIEFDVRKDFNIVPAIKDFIKIKPSHLGIGLFSVLTGQADLFMGTLLQGNEYSSISMAPLPDQGYANIFMGAIADDTPDGLSVGMMVRDELPLCLGLTQSAMLKRIGPANFTPLEPWDLEIAFRQFRGIFATDMDVGRIGSREPISDGSVSNYASGFVSDTAGRFTPAMGHNVDVSNTLAVLCTPKLQRICCDMSDVDKMAELSFLPPSGCSSTALALAGIITEQDTNIQPAALTGTSLSCLAGIITQDLMYRIGGKEKEENNEHI